MPRLDQFESVFRAASKDVFTLESYNYARVLVITDLDETAAYAYGERVKQFLHVIRDDSAVWNVVHGSEFSSPAELLDLVRQDGPQLIVTYRHLHSRSLRSPHTMGEHVEVLTQATDIAVLLLPHPDNPNAAHHAFENTNVVMALTDHLSGDDRLVNAAVRFTEANGTLFLTHIEDEATYRRYMHAISRIPSIDTESARKEIRERLLQDPRDYIASVQSILEAAQVPIQVKPIITMGRHLTLFRDLIEEHHIDLLVMNTKDEDQQAMHGLVHPLAVELRTIPLLLL
ncbi:MAG: hypothetical protein KC983_06105 [Phycisphaerales bacterium]|nr:hypothetical protein [Phycisphaerales bacterium]